MTRRKIKGGESLEEIIARTVRSFEDPSHQEKLSREIDEKKKHAAAAKHSLELMRYRRALVPSAIAKLIASGQRSLRRTDALDELLARDSKLVIVLAGNPGSGKTVAACTRLGERDGGRLVRGTELVELGADWRDRKALAAIRSASVLVIDDLGVEYREAKLASRLDDILDARISAKLQTVITTNLAAKAFEGRYGGRVWSRLHQHGAYVELDAPDMRVTPIGVARRPK